MNNFLPSPLNGVPDSGYDSAMPSAKVWRPVLVDAQSSPVTRGKFVFEDFLQVNAATANGTTATNGFKHVSSAASCTIDPSSTDPNGVLIYTLAATDNAVLTTLGGAGVGVIADFDVTKLTVFEARVKKSTVADNGLAMFCGLTDTGAAGTLIADDTGALLSTANVVGFSVLHADGDGLRSVYQKASTTAVVADTAAMVADTWTKIGLVCNPDESPSRRLLFYVDGEEVAEVASSAVSGSSFPTAALNFAFVVKNGTAAATTAAIDWYGIYQAL